jgi:hypothetical protein
MKGWRDGQQALLSGRRHTARRRVATVLLERLEAGPQPAEMCLSLASELGVHVNTVKAAKVELRIMSKQKRDGWYWALPQRTQSTSQLAFLAADPINPYTDDCAQA